MLSLKCKPELSLLPKNNILTIGLFMQFDILHKKYEVFLAKSFKVW